MDSVVRQGFDMLGKKAVDKVTRHEGVVDSVCFDLYGCVLVTLKPEVDKDGKQRDGCWFDIKRVEVTDGRRVVEPPDFLGTRAGDERGAAEHPAR